jgi:CheY-like chemotaxis protein
MDSRKLVLVVDDEELIREVLRLALESHGYSVALAADGKEALEFLSKDIRPCVMLLDLMMPVMDGWALMKTLASDTQLADIPVVIVTAFSERAHSIKFKEILYKPVELDTLYSVVGRYCA